MKDNQNSKAQPLTKQRRTQLERTESTKKRLIEGTFRCLAKFGYSATTLSLIIKEAGVSRGALLHHFPSKTDLVAAAMEAFYNSLADETGSAEVSLAQRIGILEDVYAQHAAVRIEFMVAARTDPELTKSFLREQESKDRNQYFELDSLSDPEAMEAIISSFLLGSSLLTTLLPEHSATSHAMFKKMVEEFVARSAPAADG